MKLICIALDGPAGSGKSTIAKLLAKKLGYIYLDTGAMYRSVTLACLNHQIDLTNEVAVVEFCQQQVVQFEQDEQHNQIVLLNQKDVTHEIRQQLVTKNVSLVSSYKAVREHLVSIQQQYINHGGIIMDGRDIGTVVMPNAELKIFMVASPKERAKRRYLDNLSKGIEIPIDILEKEIIDRDTFDSNREHSPLIKANDAIELDTTVMTIDEVVDMIYALANERIH